LLALCATSLPCAAQDGRVIVVGFDGADARTTERMMQEGRLPNLAKLAAGGTFAPLYSTNPAESAAGWAALNTGVNPIENGVPSFIYRQINGTSMAPAQGHLTVETVAIADFEHAGLMQLAVTWSKSKLAGVGGGAVFLAFLLLFAFVLRMNKALACLLSAVLGGVGAYGATSLKAYVPTEVPDVYKNSIKADGFWAHAARAGVDSLVLDAALAFDQPAVPGARVLGGLGIPDIRGASNGAWFIYTDAELQLGRPPEGDAAGSTNSGTVFRIDETRGAFETDVYGPLDFFQKSELAKRVAALDEQRAGDIGWRAATELRDERDKLQEELTEYTTKKHLHRVSLPMKIERSADSATVTIAGQSQELREGEWSDWYRLSFEINPLIDARAVTRAKLVSLRDDFELYLSTFDIDPSAPPFWQPVTQPRGFGAELEGWIGEPFETLGWSCMTNQMKDKQLDPETFMQDVEFTMGWRRKLAQKALERDDWRLLFSVFSTPDRVQHIMYSYHDPEHPLHDPEEAQREFEFFGKTITLSDAIPAIYEQMDARVGEIVAELEPNDTLILCADHGFTSFRWQVEVNNWLHEQGYLAVRDGLDSTADGKSTLGYVDWENTKAYAIGLGMVFLNLEGREPFGIVPRSEARALLERIQSDFLAATDDEGRRVGLDATIMQDIYPGPWGTTDYRCADLMLGFAEYFRCSWGSVVGQIRLVKEDGAVVVGPVVRDNTNRWCGDHASNSPDLVTGIFFCNKKVKVPEGGVSVLHIAPTVLERLGVEVPAEMDLAPLEFQ
jgi:predicted AlkP superfamily phosphohydrolase/phosphomutase